MPMLPILRRALLVAPLAVFAACAGTSYQAVPMPPAGAPVAADGSRVYVVRVEDGLSDRRNVVVRDGDTVIGELDTNNYLCWDRRATRGVGRAIYAGVDPALSAVEGFFELPPEPGSTVYFSMSIERVHRKPVLTRISEAEGRKLVSDRQASVR